MQQLFFFFFFRRNFSDFGSALPEFQCLIFAVVLAMPHSSASPVIEFHMNENSSHGCHQPISTGQEKERE